MYSFFIKKSYMYIAEMKNTANRKEVPLPRGTHC